MTVSEKEQIQKTEINKDLLGLFWDLQENDSNKRFHATTSLVNTLLLKQQDDNEQLSFELEYAYSRLMQGLASSRKHVKLGFVTALTNLLQNTPTSLMSSKKFIFLIENQLAASHIVTKKNGLKDLHLGRLFSLLSLIRSRKLVSEDDCESMAHTIEALLKLGNKKPYFKRMAFYGIQDLVTQASNEQFKGGMWSLLFTAFKNGWKNCSIEVLQLLITCVQCHSETCGKNFLRTCGWVEKDSNNLNIINECNFEHLTKVISATSICHPQINNFVFDVLSVIGKQNDINLVKFWTESLHDHLVQSTCERKYLALRIAIHMLSFISPAQVPVVWSNEIINNLHYALSHKHHSLNRLCSIEIPQILSEKLRESEVGAEVQYSLLFQLFSSSAGIYLDQTRNSNIISSVVSTLKFPALLKYITWLKNLFIKGTDERCSVKNVELNDARRWSLNQLNRLVRSPSLPRSEDWVKSIVNFIVFHAYFNVINPGDSSSVVEVTELGQEFSSLSDGCRSHAQTICNNLLSYLANLELLPISAEVVETPSSKTNGLVSGLGSMSSGKSWLQHVLCFVSSLLSSNEVELVVEFNEEIEDAWHTTVKNIEKMVKLRGSRTESSAEGRLFELLLGHMSFHLLSSNVTDRSASLNVLNDLNIVVAEKFSKKHQLAAASLHWVEVLVEVILSLLLSESRSICSIAEQAFRILCPHLTDKALQLVLDMLLKNPEDVMDVGKEEADEDSDKDEADSDDNSDDEEEEEEEDDSDHNDDADDQFRLRVQQALGEAAIGEGELSDAGDDSEDDLSDDAMMQLDPVLCEIFKRRKKPSKGSSRKQMNVFHVRCLDLIDIFLSRQHSNSYLMFDLVFPLLRIIERTATKPFKQSVTERATVILKVKLCRTKNLPRQLDSNVISQCGKNVEKLLEMSAKESRGLFINQLISQCCLLHVKALLACESTNQKDCSTALQRVLDLYSQRLDLLMKSKQSRVQQCLFTDLIRQQPGLAQKLADKLIVYAVEAVRPYLRLQACHMLTSLCRSKQSRDHMTSLSQSIYEMARDYLKSLSKAGVGGNPKHLMEMIRLLQFSIQCMLDSDRDWSDLIGTLRKFLEVAIVKRSQGISNCVWALLQKLGVSRTKVKKDRKRKHSSSSDVQDAAVEEATEPSNDVVPDESEVKESSRKKKKRIMREKRKGAGRRPKPKKLTEGGDDVKNDKNKIDKSNKKSKKSVENSDGV